MSLACDLCAALGSEGFSNNTTEEELRAHAHIHRQQEKFYASDDCDQSVNEIRDGILKYEDDLADSDSCVAAKQKGATSRVDPVAAFCRKHIVGQTRNPDAKVECAICGQKLRLFCSDNGVNSKHLRQHAIGHLGKLMYACTRCDHKAVTHHAMTGHLRRVHVVSGMEHYKDFTVTHENEIIEMLSQCFGRKNACEPESNTKKINSIYRYTAQLCRARWGKNRHIYCNECGQRLAVRQPGRTSFRSREAASHAFIHLAKFLFFCRFCSHKTVSADSMKTHLQKNHSLGPQEENFVSTMAENYEEIIEIIDRCYGLVEPGKEPSSKKQEKNGNSVTGENNSIPHIWDVDTHCQNLIKSRAGDRKLLAQRQIHSRRLLSKFSESGMITCRVCSHDVNVKQRDGSDLLSGQKAMWHASTHVEKPLYRCKRCQKNIHVMSSVYRHMKKEHGITKGVTKELEDFSDQLHQEIMDALTRSFDWTQSTESEATVSHSDYRSSSSTSSS